MPVCDNHLKENLKNFLEGVRSDGMRQISHLTGLYIAHCP